MKLKCILLCPLINIICKSRWLHYTIRFCSANDDHSTNNSTSSPPITSNNNNDPQRPMNVLILYGDDWRYDSLGSINPMIRTPNLDMLSSNGIHFMNSFVTTSVCWVSRANYFTGQYMSRHLTTTPREPKFYNNWYTTSWPSILQRKQLHYIKNHNTSSTTTTPITTSYYVGHIGKWQFRNMNNFTQTAFNFSSMFEGYHIDMNTGIRATDRAYNDTIRFLNQVEQINLLNQQQNNNLYHPFALTIALFPPKMVQDSPTPTKNYQVRDDIYNNLYKNMSIPYQSQNFNDISYHKLPYFLSNQYNIPKTEARKRYDNTYLNISHYQENMKRFYSLITEVDGVFGKIITELKQRNMYNNTIILFTTDNGFFHSEHGISGKWYPYQESIRVPMILYDPRMEQQYKNTKNYNYVYNIDLAPTIISIANRSELLYNITHHNQSLMMQGLDITQLYLTNNNQNDSSVSSSSTTNNTMTTTRLSSSSSLFVTSKRNVTNTTTTTTTSSRKWQKWSSTTTTTSSNWRMNELYYEHPTIIDRNYLTSSTGIITMNYSYMIYPEWNNYECLYNLYHDPNEQNNIINITNYTIVLQYLRERHNILQQMAK